MKTREMVLHINENKIIASGVMAFALSFRVDMECGLLILGPSDNRIVIIEGKMKKKSEKAWSSEKGKFEKCGFLYLSGKRTFSYVDLFLGTVATALSICYVCK
uniref:DUF2953 domain-containing protein n=1 Tax=Steinernema glaseri TaxID=37863 RepID=A0A1I7YB19_9BILA